MSKEDQSGPVGSRSRADEGFTLIELLVVLLIIGLLLAIAIPTFLSVTNSANTTAAQSDLQVALTGVKIYYTQNGQSYANLDTQAFNNIDVGLSAVPGTEAEGTLHVISLDNVSPSLVILSDYAPGQRRCYGIVDDDGAQVAILGQPSSFAGTLFFVNTNPGSVGACAAASYDLAAKPANVVASTNGFSGLTS